MGLTGNGTLNSALPITRTFDDNALWTPLKAHARSDVGLSRLAVTIERAVDALAEEVERHRVVILHCERRLEFLAALTHSRAVLLAVGVVERGKVSGILGGELMIESQLKDDEQAENQRGVS